MKVTDEKEVKKHLKRLAALLGFGWSVSLAITFLFVAIITFAVCAEYKPFGTDILDQSNVPFSWVVLIWMFLHGVNGAHARETLIQVLKTDGGTGKILGMFEREVARTRMFLRWSVSIFLAVAFGIWMSLDNSVPT